MTSQENTPSLFPQESGRSRVGCSKFVPPQQPTPQAAVSTDPVETKPPVNTAEFSIVFAGPLPVKIGPKLGYVDRSTGKIVANPQFDGASMFMEGLAVVCLGKGCEQNNNGWPSVSVSYDAKPDEHKFGYIDETGQYVVNPQYDDADAFSEGLAAVCVGDCSFRSVGKWGFIDKQGKVVIPLQFAQVHDFSPGGVAAACVGKCSGSIALNNWGGGKWGFIDKTGKFVIAPQFDDVGFFDPTGVASVVLGTGPNDEKRGWIDKTGKFIWNPSN